MKKKILLYALIGAPVGVTVGTVITILISLTAGDGNFYPVVPSLIEKCGNELNAVIVQTVCLLIAIMPIQTLLRRMFPKANGKPRLMCGRRSRMCRFMWCIPAIT